MRSAYGSEGDVRSSRYSPSVAEPRTPPRTPADAARQAFAENIGWSGEDTQGTRFEVLSPVSNTPTFPQTSGGPPAALLLRITLKDGVSLILAPADKAFYSALMQAYGVFTDSRSGKLGEFKCPPNAKCLSREDSDARFAGQMRALAETVGITGTSGKTTVSTNGAQGTMSNLTDKPWFWPAVVIVAAAGVMVWRNRS